MERRADPVERTVLRYLYDLAARAGGYLRRGVRGWAHHADIEMDVKLRIGETLSQLHRRRLTEREDVRSAGRKRPVWIYRISKEGVRRLAAWDGLDGRLRELPQPLEGSARETAVYMTAGAILALRALRLAWVDRAPSPHLPGERGWRTERELVVLIYRPETEQPEWLLEMVLGDPDELDAPEPWRVTPEESQSEGPQRFYPDDLWWLVRAGFAQRFAVECAPRRRPILLYRITPAGLAAEVLTWHEPSP